MSDFFGPCAGAGAVEIMVILDGFEEMTSVDMDVSVDLISVLLPKNWIIGFRAWCSPSLTARLQNDRELKIIFKIESIFDILYVNDCMTEI